MTGRTSHVARDVEEHVARWQSIVTASRAERTCRRKTAHATKDKAHAEADRLAHDNKRKEAEILSVFQCGICRKWHVGNITVGDLARMYPWKKVGRIHYVNMLFRITGGNWQCLDEMHPEELMKFLEGLDLRRLTSAIIVGQRNFDREAKQRLEAQDRNHKARLGKTTRPAAVVQGLASLQGPKPLERRDRHVPRGGIDFGYWSRGSESR